MLIIRVYLLFIVITILTIGCDDNSNIINGHWVLYNHVGDDNISPYVEFDFDKRNSFFLRGSSGWRPLEYTIVDSDSISFLYFAGRYQRKIKDTLIFRDSKNEYFLKRIDYQSSFFPAEDLRLMNKTRYYRQVLDYPEFDSILSFELESYYNRKSIKVFTTEEDLLIEPKKHSN